MSPRYQTAGYLVAIRYGKGDLVRVTVTQEVVDGQGRGLQCEARFREGTDFQTVLNEALSDASKAPILQRQGDPKAG